MTIAFSQLQLQKICTMVLLSVVLAVATPPQVVTATSTSATQKEQIATIQYLQGVLAQLQLQLLLRQSGQVTPSVTSEVYSTSQNTVRVIDRNKYNILVLSLTPTSVERKEATLRGEMDKGSSETAEVWFEYGAGGYLNKRSDVTEVTYTGRQQITQTITSLAPNTKYNYRLVVEDMDGYRQYGPIWSFMTVETASAQSFSGLPVAETDGVNYVTAYGARLQSFVTMNDYSNGTVFFVYSENKSAVNEAEDYRTFNEVEKESYAIAQRVAGDEFSGRDTVFVDVYNLSPATEYYYRACVEFKSNRTVLRCSGTQRFTTANN